MPTTPQTKSDLRINRLQFLSHMIRRIENQRSTARRAGDTQRVQYLTDAWKIVVAANESIMAELPSISAVGVRF